MSDISVCSVSNNSYINKPLKAAKFTHCQTNYPADCYVKSLQPKDKNKRFWNFLNIANIMSIFLT